MFIYVRKTFVTLHEDKPADYVYGSTIKPLLSIGGVETDISKYGIEFGYRPVGDAFDYPEFAFGGASLTRPTDYTARDSYKTESYPSGDTDTFFSRWVLVQVPDNFVIPWDLDQNGLLGNTHWLDSSKISFAANVVVQYVIDKVVEFFDVKAQINAGITHALDNLAKKFGVADVFDTFKRSLAVKDAVFDIQTKSLNYIQWGMDNINNPNIDFAKIDADGQVLRSAQETALNLAKDNTNDTIAAAVEAYQYVAKFSNTSATGATVDISFLTGDAVVNESSAINGSDGPDVILAASRAVATLANVIPIIKTNVINAGAGNDIVLGNNTEDQVDPGTGHDYVNTGAGDDTILVTSPDGGDYLRGGDGRDAVIFSMNAAITVNLSSGFEFTTAQSSVPATRLFEIEDVTAQGAFAATITGNNYNNMLTGGSAGDSLYGGIGDDTLVGGAGSNTLDGGSGTDTARYQSAYSSSLYTITHNPNGTVTVSGSGISDTLSNVERLSFIGTSIAIGAAPLSDFGGSGHSSLLWQNDSGQAAMWLMNGPAVQSTAIVGSNPGASWHIKGSGDFDGDGIPDILWQNDSGQAGIWFMNGTGINGSSLVGSNPGTGWHIMGAGDFDGDTKADILWQNNDGRTAIWMMNGATVGVNGLASAPSLGKSWRVVGSGDFDGDTKSDIIFQRANGDIEIWLMNGLNVVSAGLLSPGTASLHVKAIGDFSGDGKSDILWQSDAGRASIWEMNGIGSTNGGNAGPNPGPTWHIVGTGLFDAGNNNLDILWQNDNGNVAAWYMNNTVRTGGDDLAAPGTSWKIANSGTAQQTFQPVRQPNDFNGDGKADVLWQNNDGTAAIWTLNGALRTGGDTLSPNPGTAWHVVGSGDFNADGKSDVLWQNNDGTAAIWFMNGAVRIGGDVVSPNPGAAWHVKGAGDFNADGKADVLWQNNDGTVAVWTMNGTTHTGDGVIASNPGSSWHVIGSGDFNGDTKSDILFQNDDGRAAVWLVNGFLLLQGAAVGSNPGPTWHVKGAGDFDGDGKSDILWQNDDGRAAIWLMDGVTQTGGAALALNPGPSWSVKGAADTNGDGTADILFQNNNTGEAAVWLMSGFTKIGGDTLTPVPGTAWHLVANSA